MKIKFITDKQKNRIAESTPEQWEEWFKYYFPQYQPGYKAKPIHDYRDHRGTGLPTNTKAAK